MGVRFPVAESVRGTLTRFPWLKAAIASGVTSSSDLIGM